MPAKKVNEGAVAAAAAAATLPVKLGPATKRALGWIPQLHDPRDKMVDVKAMFLSLGLPKLPHKYSMAESVTNFYDQKNLGSCTANAALGAVVFTEVEETKKVRPPMSRLYTYWYTRFMQNTVDYDSGATIRGVFKALATYGYCFEKLWPYDVANFKTKPSMAVGTDAKKHCLRLDVDYAAVPQDPVSLKTVLAANNPIVFGFSVPESFMSQEVRATGVFKMPKAGERIVGGHAVLAVGYDDDTGEYIILNSWGKTWGAGGFVRMPQAFLHSRACSDFWTCKATPAVAT